MKLKTLFVLSALLFVMPASVNAGGAVPPANIKIEKAECGQPYKDSATVWFSWESRADALSYRFYGKTVNDPEYKFYGEIKENNYKMIIKPQFDYYVAVSAVYKYLDETPGTVESRKSDQFLLAGENLLSACRKNETPKIEPSPKQEEKTIIIKDNSGVKELEDKVNTLEKRLAETQQKQSKLEEIVNNLLGLIKQLFRFK